MNKDLHMLLYSDGSAVGSQAFELGVRIALAAASRVDILALARTADEAKLTDEQVMAAEKLETADISVRLYPRLGPMPREVLDQAETTHYDLIVVGSRGRRGITRLIAGSRARSILKGTATSVLVVKGREREEIDDFLLCSAAGPASEDTVRFAAHLARALDASVTLLHVMSQVALEEHARVADLEAKAEELMETDAREGVHLENMMEILLQEGVEAKVLVRHGLIVDEIIAESKQGHFDMLVIGAHTAPGIEGLLSSDLAQLIMLSTNRPVLIVRQDQQT
jgi:nucleotide-binding universal stress UspA family protein